MNVNDLFPSRFLKAHDLNGKPYTLTISNVSLEDVGHGAEKESKLTLAFEKATKMMLLNRTNAMIIASLYGPETDAWKGKAVTVYSARVKAFGAWHDALRIKEQVPARNVGHERMTEAMQEQPPIDDENDLLDVEEGPIDAAPVKPAANPFDEQPASTLARANADQLREINRLGLLVYPKEGEWAARQTKWAEDASQGARNAIKKLYDMEAKTLIAKLNNRLQARLLQVVEAAEPIAT